MEKHCKHHPVKSVCQNYRPFDQESISVHCYLQIQEDQGRFLHLETYQLPTTCWLVVHERLCLLNQQFSKISKLL